MRRHSLTVFLSLVFALSTQADEVYKTVDEDGNVIYTDNPLEQGEKVEIKEPNTLPAPGYKARSNRGSDSETPGAEEPANYQLYISSPADGAQVGPQQSRLDIHVNLQPSLRDNHSLQLYFNGTPHGQPQGSTSFSIEKLRRGQKNISVSVLDAEGEVLASSSSIKVYVIRPNPKPR